MGQIFSVIFGMDLIKKPVTAVIGGTMKIFQGAYEVQQCILYVLRGIWIKKATNICYGFGLGASM